jgi:hypothetical protein
MTCCVPTIIPFSSNDELVIAYTAGMKENYGDIPTVKVYHLDGGEYILANIRVGFIGVPANEIRVYNGGPATGFVKISK